MNKLTKDECEKMYINTRCLLSAMSKQVVCVRSMANICMDVISRLVHEHFDNPKLSYDELEVGEPYWNEKRGCYFLVVSKDEYFREVKIVRVSKTYGTFTGYTIPEARLKYEGVYRKKVV